MPATRHRSRLSGAGRVLVALGLGAALARPARADPPAAARYNEPASALPRDELERRIEALAAQVAAADRRTAPRPEPRLQRAVAALVALDEPRGPDNDTVEAALRLYGIVEPPPLLIVAGGATGADDALVDELKVQLQRGLGSGRYERCAAAVSRRGDAVRVVVALQESFLELQPVPRALPSGGPAPLRGRLRSGFQRPSAFVSTPDGRTEPLALAGDAAHFDGTFHCGPARGRYQIEIVGEDRFGSTVLANFPVYCGTPAPSVLEPAKLAHEAAPTDARAAEAALLHLLNEDRARAGLRPLALDRRLADVARGHCRDMLAHGFVGHVSPTTGDAAARTERAKIAAALVLENVARASTPGEVERGLMASPGHRRNILSAEATKVGIGAVLSDGVAGARELLVTQLFIADEAAFQPASPDELRVRLDADRRSHGLPPFLRDPALDRIADGVARDLASGRTTPQGARGGLDRAFQPLGARYRSVRSLFAIAAQITQIADSMKASLAGAAGPQALGIGLHGGPTTDGAGQPGRTAHHAVVIVAQPR